MASDNRRVGREVKQVFEKGLIYCHPKIPAQIARSISMATAFSSENAREIEEYQPDTIAMASAPPVTIGARPFVEGEGPDIIEMDTAILVRRRICFDLWECVGVKR
jgi:hypothetical protein